MLHVDEDYLESSSVANLAQLLVHEGWHLAGHPTHPANDVGPIYLTSPYSLAQGCVP